MVRRSTTRKTLVNHANLRRVATAVGVALTGLVLVTVTTGYGASKVSGSPRPPARAVTMPTSPTQQAPSSNALAAHTFLLSGIAPGGDKFQLSGQCWLSALSASLVFDSAGDTPVGRRLVLHASQEISPPDRAVFETGAMLMASANSTLQIGTGKTHAPGSVAVRRSREMPCPKTLQQPQTSTNTIGRTAVGLLKRWAESGGNHGKGG